MNFHEEIVFKKIAPEQSALICNSCGNIAYYPDAKEATLFPFVVDEPCCFVVCSEICERAFLAFPTLDHYIMKSVNELAQRKDLALKVDYLLENAKLNEEITNN